MPTFMCFLNWTDQAAKALKDAPKRYEATKALVTRLGGRLVCAYVTTGQYDVALVVEMPTGQGDSTNGGKSGRAPGLGNLPDAAPQQA